MSNFVLGKILDPCTIVNGRMSCLEALVLNNLLCCDTNTLPLYLPCSTSIAHFETVFTSRGDVHKQRSLKCTPASEVLC